MSKPIVFMFSGQGSQYFQMGRELYENHPRFKMWMDHCDEIVEPLIDASLVEIIYDDSKHKTEPFDRLLHTNPALLSIQYAMARVLMENGIKPDYVLGYSLGEFVASVICGAITLEEGLELLVEYARILESDTPLSGMMAVIESQSIITEKPQLFDKVWVSGRNFDKHFVVSGLKQDVDNLESTLKGMGTIHQQLAVRYGFHTELIDPVKDQFMQLAGMVDMYPIEIPTWSGLKAGRLDEVTEDYLWQVTREPVEFQKVVKAMLAEGDYTFIDAGPSATLSTFVRYILPQGSQSEFHEVLNQYGKNLTNLDKLKTALVM